MSEEARIFEEGLSSVEGVDVGAADADATDADAGLAGRGIGEGAGAALEAARLGEDDFALGGHGAGFNADLRECPQISADPNLIICVHRRERSESASICVPFSRTLTPRDTDGWP